eukprot:TRINITY_DN3542_c0_g4_i5.p2 TRINITY_DN3542_c0_g4~~TRINITY_DN3542_c0_g4_i5.p2  ORF type:complete len:169 (-),score=58.68 TRINITY_DN3542_c0_g4_i5:681-1187(-)
MGVNGSTAGTISTEGDFEPSKELKPKDMILVDMLNSRDEPDICWVVTDPDLEDNPIVFSSEGFSRYTGYAKSEIEGRNCRFLQGKETNPADVETIRAAIGAQTDANVCLLNYRKDGTAFLNQFFICPLHDAATGAVAYYLGVQAAVRQKEGGQTQKNAGWVYQMGLHA